LAEAVRFAVVAAKGIVAVSVLATPQLRRNSAIPQFLLAPRDAQNIEMYYHYKITPAIEFTPDVQCVNGMLGMLGMLTGGDGAIVAGIRLNMIR
jgi:carbohydrate-selective porin OprB